MYYLVKENNSSGAYAIVKNHKDHMFYIMVKELERSHNPLFKLVTGCRVFRCLYEEPLYKDKSLRKVEEKAMLEIL